MSPENNELNFQVQKVTINIEKKHGSLFIQFCTFLKSQKFLIKNLECYSSPILKQDT